MIRLHSLKAPSGAIRRLEQVPVYGSLYPDTRYVGDQIKDLLLCRENGSGKSTLLEAIPDNYGFGREGGNRSFYQTTSSSSDHMY